MLTVALIGPDGSGKTAIAERLLASPPCPIKYLYMGTSIESSNFALPTSRLAHRAKVYQHKQTLKRCGQDVPEKITLHGAEHRVDSRGRIAATLRMLNRMAEIAFRQSISWAYSLRGNVVLYDRHFLFDVCAPPSSANQRRLTSCILDWYLQHVVPRPGLVIFLDAPSEVLYERKQEIPPELLQVDYDELLEKSHYVKNFVRVDATRPLDEVVDQIRKTIVRHYRGETCIAHIEEAENETVQVPARTST